jgi:hypothetical protein
MSLKVLGEARLEEEPLADLHLGGVAVLGGQGAGSGRSGGASLASARSGENDRGGDAEGRRQE